MIAIIGIVIIIATGAATIALTAAAATAVIARPATHRACALRDIHEPFTTTRMHSIMHYKGTNNQTNN